MPEKLGWFDSMILRLILSRIKANMEDGMLSGYKTYIAALGLLGLAVYQATTGDFKTAIETLFAAMTAAGIRHAISQK